MAYNFGYYGGFNPIVPAGVPLAAPFGAQFAAAPFIAGGPAFGPNPAQAPPPQAPAAAPVEEKKKEAPAPPPEVNPNLKLIQEILEASKGGSSGDGLTLADGLEFYEYLREKRRRNNLSRLF